MVCKRCKEDPSPLPKSQCGFNWTFSDDNLHCKTLLALRDLVLNSLKGVLIWEADQSIAVIPIPHQAKDQAVTKCNFIILGWYKSRARIEQAYQIKDFQDSLEDLTLEVAEAVLDHFEPFLEMVKWKW